MHFFDFVVYKRKSLENNIHHILFYLSEKKKN